MPQQSVDQVRIGQSVAVKVDAFKDQTFSGEISAINPKVDASTRNVQVRATLKNADHRLLPGMYATVDIATGAPQNYITLPQTAITYNPYGDTVYVVDNKGGQSGKPRLDRAADLRHHRRERAAIRSPCSKASTKATWSSPPARSSCTTARRC